MTLYQRSTFTVPAAGKNNPSMCAEKGHSMADRKGLCIACGEKVDPVEAQRLAFYRELLASGLSDFEARGTAWPGYPFVPGHAVGCKCAECGAAWLRANYEGCELAPKAQQDAPQPTALPSGETREPGEYDRWNLGLADVEVHAASTPSPAPRDPAIVSESGD